MSSNSRLPIHSVADTISHLSTLRLPCAEPLDAAPAEQSTLSPTPGFTFGTTNEHDVPEFPDATSQPNDASTAPIFEPGQVCVKYQTGLQVWVNVCSASNIPAPATHDEAEIQKALHADPSTVYQVPVFLSSPNEKPMDATGVIFDAVIHPVPLARAMGDFDFRLYLIELCLEWVEERSQMQLSRQFTLPPVPYKGPIRTHSLYLPRARLVESVQQASHEDPPTPKQLTPEATKILPDGSILASVTLPVAPKRPAAMVVQIRGTDITIGYKPDIKLIVHLPRPAGSNCRALYVKSTNQLKFIYDVN
ncbi:hypothetical protein H4R34_003728 [Dimargaris verticillata]|uniref:PIH1 N-terminal domain-containing protein n=1 Tax=Dimargaris verticillata TaxID=2761393 RepID=A0A9W8ECC5_9FUNG|nr:hypothetical protein H4R34_003728 [Dimargaris verticillata]